MAKFNKQELFKIAPMSIVQNRALTFGVYLYLLLNERMILYKGSGVTVDDKAAIERMLARGLKHFFVLESEREAFEKWIKGTAFEKAHLELAKDAQAQDPAAASSTTAPPASIPASPPAPASAAVPEPTLEAAASAAKNLVDAPPALSAKEQVMRETTAQEAIAATDAKEIMAELLKPPPENQPALDSAKDLAKKILMVSPAGSMIADIIESKESEHATTVAIYSMLFSMGLEKKEPQTLQDLIIASLLHDIGMTQIAAEAVPVPRLSQQPAQKQAFDEHVKLGLELLTELDYVPNKRVVGILGQHHEKFNGSGYPAHLESFRIDELSQLVGLADLIDSIGRGHYDGTARSLNDSLLVVAQTEKQSTFPEFFNPDLFGKVMAWLKKGGGQDYIAAVEKNVSETKQKLLKAG